MGILAEILYAAVPLPATLYVAAAVYLREKRYKRSPEENCFAAASGVTVSISLGLSIGLLPALYYLLNFQTFHPSRTAPDTVQLIALLVTGPPIGGFFVGLAAFRNRRIFQIHRIPYYLTVLPAAAAIVPPSYVAADYATYLLFSSGIH